MKLVLAQNYKVGSKMTQAAFAAEFQYGLRAGQGVPMKDPKTHQPVTDRANAAFQAGLAWGQDNVSCRDVSVVQAALESAWMNR